MDPPPPPHDVAPWVNASDGTMPLVLLAPHGGDLSPAELPDRSCAGCVLLNDANTQALATAVSDAFFTRTGLRPFVVVNRLHRRKFDAHRELTEATDGYVALEPLWDLWHERVDSAKARATRVHPRALLLDLHGHAHAIARIELGYLLTASHLRETDEQLSARLGNSSIARLDSVGLAGARGAAMLRGAGALGSRLATLGFASVPSDVDSAPLVGQEYFNGGYNTERHGSQASGAVDAIQLEHHYAGLRDTPANRAAYAEALVTALLAYLDDHYGWSPPA
jgi:N-formylglutamate amidohydrolase